MLATTIPAPRSLKVFHTLLARMLTMFHSAACTLAARETRSLGIRAGMSGRMEATSERAATALRVAASETTRTVLTIQNEVKLAPRALSIRTKPRWLAVATDFRLFTTNQPRPVESFILGAALRSARWASTAQYVTRPVDCAWCS